MEAAATTFLQRQLSRVPSLEAAAQWVKGADTTPYKGYEWSLPSYVSLSKHSQKSGIFLHSSYTAKNRHFICIEINLM
jgi:hypothetical protein